MTSPPIELPAAWNPFQEALLAQAAATGRGPRREGLFALWLFVRVAGGTCLSPPVAERAHRRRVAALEHRLTSLTLPAPLRRALAGALTQLRETDPAAAGRALSMLAAPARDTLGPEPADLLLRAAREARPETAHPSSPSRARR